MASINVLKKRMSQLDAEKAALLAKVSITARKNADTRKYSLGGALLKLATSDPGAYEVLKKAWALGEKDKPRAFEDVSIPSPIHAGVPATMR